MTKWMGSTLGAALIVGSPQLLAADFGLEYNTELQTDFKGNYCWMNLLRLDASVAPTDWLAFQGATISAARTAAEPLLDDLQGFSNIDADNLPLAIAVLGAEFTYKRSTYFLGIRNVNEDYFTSDVTAFFLNSSCGIFPTLSTNYDIANYPLASWCVHYAARWDRLALQTSLYPGQGYNRILGHDNVFTFAPRRDGLFSITTIDYTRNDSNYSLGCALHCGQRSRDVALLPSETTPTPQGPPTPQRLNAARRADGEPGQQRHTASRQADGKPETEWKVSVAPWVNIEQCIGPKWHLLLQASLATAAENCSHYIGLGATFTHRRLRLGLFADYARFTPIASADHHPGEAAAELTARYTLSKIITLQTSLELIHTDHPMGQRAGHLRPAALTRLTITL